MVGLADKERWLLAAISGIIQSIEKVCQELHRDTWLPSQVKTEDLKFLQRKKGSNWLLVVMMGMMPSSPAISVCLWHKSGFHARKVSIISGGVSSMVRGRVVGVKQQSYNCIRGQNKRITSSEQNSTWGLLSRRAQKIICKNNSFNLVSDKK